jgi:cytoskeletal protein CcmA (bactofilin family)
LVLFAKSTGGRMKHGSELGTIIGQDATVDGKLNVSHAVRIDGRLMGELTSTDTITVGSTGRVEGTLIGESIVIGGQVEGSLKSSGLITLEAGSRFTGDLEAARLVIIEGALFNGRSSMGSTSQSDRISPRKINLEPSIELEPAE